MMFHGSDGPKSVFLKVKKIVYSVVAQFVSGSPIMIQNQEVNNKLPGLTLLIYQKENGMSKNNGMSYLSVMKF